MPDTIDLVDFTGGLNLRQNEFQLGPTESPAMLNVEIDPRGGFQTREGWTRWNSADIVASPTAVTWDPRNAEYHPLSTGSFLVYVANGSTVYAADATSVFSDLTIPVGASPHLADFASWGDTVHIACGRPNASHKRAGTAAAVAFPYNVVFNNNYTTPLNGQMPAAEHVEAHGGYLFVANTNEAGVNHHNRLRWSHPDQPEDWHENDKLDIEVGGGQITALRSFRDHLLIFKTESVWALYGYDLDSWQLVRVSTAVGVPSPTAVTRSESAIYFYSSASRNGIYGYSGESPVLLSTRLDPAMESVADPDDVWLGWSGRRLWVSVPWVSRDVTGDPATVALGTTFVFDPEVGEEGAWMAHRPALGTLRQVITHTDINNRPLATLHGDSGAACLVRIGAAEKAADWIDEGGGWTGFETFYRTRWLTAGSPTQRKSWLRPKFVVRQPPEDVTIRADAYWNYDATNARRTRQLTLPGTYDTTYWRAGGFDDPAGGGFDFKELGPLDPSGRGALFQGEAADSPRGIIGRSGGSVGVADSIQIKVSTAATDLGKAWRVDAAIFPVNLRRKTT